MLEDAESTVYTTAWRFEGLEESIYILRDQIALQQD